MSDELTCWAYVSEFTGRQAALAIVGEPETDDPAALRKAKPVLDRMRRAYEGTREWFAESPEGISEWRLRSVYGDDIPPPERRLMSVDNAIVPGGQALVSVEMVDAEVRAANGAAKALDATEANRLDLEDEAIERLRSGEKGRRFLEWLRSPAADFDQQTFLRQDLARWAQATGASSLYSFDRQLEQPDREVFGAGAQASDAQSASAALHPRAEDTGPAPTQHGRCMKKAAMVKELAPGWPTIEADLREASRPSNQDLKAANVARGMWDADVALRWAESHGRLVKKAPQPGPPSPFAGLGS